MHLAIRITLDHVWLFAFGALIALRVFLTPVPPHDFWWHMAMGRLIFETGAIPTVDSFSFTQSGELFYNQGWLAQIVMYLVYRIGSVPLLVFMQAIVLVLTYGLLLRLCIRRSGAVRLSAGLLLMTTMPLSFDNWNIRPQSYAFLLFVAFVYVLTAWRENWNQRAEGNRKSSTQRVSVIWRWRLWMAPLLMILWVNIHGSFVLGGVLIALTFLGEAGRRFVENRREALAWANQPIGTPEEILQRTEQQTASSLSPLLFWGVLTTLAMLVNPRGIEVLGYVRSLLNTSAVTQLVTEWAAPTIREPGGIIFFLFLMVCVIILVYSRQRPNPVDMLLAGAFLWLALGAVRNIVWFGMIMTPLLAVQSAAWKSTPSRQQKFNGLPALNATLIGLIALPLVLTLPWFKPTLDLPPELGNLLSEDTPVAAVEFLKADPEKPERLFHAMGYGSYLIWEAPEQKVFIDSRI
ncbi:MAG: hypothetical protein MI924_00430, partial [Chloroflexales bacterium]|nr:hypothetical protein [Chloroflexales bacterium]